MGNQCSTVQYAVQCSAGYTTMLCSAVQHHRDRYFKFSCQLLPYCLPLARLVILGQEVACQCWLPKEVVLEYGPLWSLQEIFSSLHDQLERH